MTQLYNQFGGDAKIEQVVALFYEEMLKDKLLSRFFEGADIEKLKQKQNWFLATVLMATAEGTADYMTKAHSDLVNKFGLNHAHFIRVIDHLDAAMRELNVHPEARSTLLKAAKTLESAVLCEDV